MAFIVFRSADVFVTRFNSCIINVIQLSEFVLEVVRRFCWFLDCLIKAACHSLRAALLTPSSSQYCGLTVHNVQCKVPCSCCFSWDNCWLSEDGYHCWPAALPIFNCATATVGHMTRCSCCQRLREVAVDNVPAVKVMSFFNLWLPYS